MKLYEQVILTDIEFSDSQNVDQALWKNVFYQVIERFRQLLKDPTHDNIDNIRNILLTLLDEVGMCAPRKNLNEACSRKIDQRALQVPGNHKVAIVSVLQGALFFDSLLQKLQTTYQFRLEDYMDGVAVRARPLRKTVEGCLSWPVCLDLNVD